MRRRVNKNGSELTRAAMNAEIPGGWKEITDKAMCDIGLDPQVEPSKNSVKQKVAENFKQKTDHSSRRKSKIKYLLENRHHPWKPEKRENYLDELTRNQAAAIANARTRMLPCKGNRNSLNDENYEENAECDRCDMEVPDDQSHLLTICPAIHPDDDNTKTNVNEIFAENPETVKEAGKKIAKILDTIEKKPEE